MTLERKPIPGYEDNYYLDPVAMRVVNSKTGRNISEAVQGRPKPWVAENKSIAIIAIDGWGNETWFKSAREAGRVLGIDQSSITAVLRGRRRNAGGYKFRYDE